MLKLKQKKNQQNQYLKDWLKLYDVKMPIFIVK